MKTKAMLEEELKQVRNTLDSLRADYADMRQDRDRHRDEAADLRAEVLILRGRESALRQRIAQLQGENHIMKKLLKLEEPSKPQLFPDFRPGDPNPYAAAEDVARDARIYGGR